MNEVRLVQTTAPIAVGSTSSTGKVEANAKPSGNALPEVVSTEDVKPAVQATKVSAQELMSEVSVVNDYVQTIQRDLQFSVDKELDRTVIRVVDRDSGEVIRQIPEDIFLELARRLKDDGEINLLNALG